MADINQFWATPFYRGVTEIALAESVRDYVLANETDSRRKRNSPQAAHPQVFESEFDFLDWPSPIPADLKRALHGHLAEAVRLANGLDDSAMRQLRFHSHSWFHVTRRGGYFRQHNHPLASWSLVYCADRGDDDPPNEHEAGHLVFQDPRQTASMYLDTANRTMRRDFAFDAVRVRPNQGDVLIFPSYLQHAVEPYGGSRPRITVAANYWFQTFDQSGAGAASRS